MLALWRRWTRSCSGDGRSEDWLLNQSWFWSGCPNRKRTNSNLQRTRSELGGGLVWSLSGRSDMIGALWQFKPQMAYVLLVEASERRAWHGTLQRALPNAKSLLLKHDNVAGFEGSTDIVVLQSEQCTEDALQPCLSQSLCPTLAVQKPLCVLWQAPQIH